MGRYRLNTLLKRQGKVGRISWNLSGPTSIVRQISGIWVVLVAPEKTILTAPRNQSCAGLRVELAGLRTGWWGTAAIDGEEDWPPGRQRSD